MKKLNNLLAATDFSAAGNLAAARACQLAENLSSQLELIHVFNLQALQQLQDWLEGEQRNSLRDKLRHQAREELDNLSTSLTQQYGGHPAARLLEGTASSTIAAQADAKQSDLVIVGAHGAGHLHELLVGSTPIKLLKHLRCPLLIVRQTTEPAYRRILVPIDITLESFAHLQLARELAPEAQIIALHVFELPFEGRLRMAGIEERQLQELIASAHQQAQEKLQAQVQQIAGEQIHCAVVHGEPSRGIVQYAREQDCDLILLARRQQHPLQEMLLGSTSRHVLHESACDVLISTS